MHRWCLLVLAACSGPRARAKIDAAPAPPPLPTACEALGFADTVPVPEASGAVVTRLDGRDVVLVVGDSGNDGAYLYVDATTGAPVAGGNLPLGKGASDDLEGISLDGDDLLAITSSGWMRRWHRDGATFTLADGPYPIGEVDPTLEKLSALEVPPAGTAFACAGETVNCGKNYEALCTGWVGSKSEGRLFRLVRDGDRFRVDPSRSIEVEMPGALSDCDVDASGAIWLATNGFDGRVLVVRGTTVTSVPIPAQGFPEAIAVGEGGVIYRFHDTGGAPSHAEMWRCR